MGSRISETTEKVMQLFRDHLADHLDNLPDAEYIGEGGDDEDGTYVAQWSLGPDLQLDVTITITPSAQ